MKDNKNEVNNQNQAKKIARGTRKSQFEKLTKTTEPAVPNRAHTEMKQEQEEAR